MAVRAVMNEHGVNHLFPNMKLQTHKEPRSKFSEGTLQKAEKYIPEADLEALSLCYAEPKRRKKIESILSDTD